MESDACDAVRDTTLGLPLDVDYDALKTKALNGGVDWVPPAFVYLDGTHLPLVKCWCSHVTLLATCSVKKCACVSLSCSCLRH